MAIPTVSMKYGKSGRGSGANLPRLIMSGTMTGATLENIVLPTVAGSVYWIVSSSITTATDVYSGHQTHQLEVPFGTKYGNTAGHSNTMFSQGTGRISITANADSTFTLSRTNANYTVRYVVYKVA